METKQVTFWELLSESRIVIPIIQRDYAQGRQGKENLRKRFLLSLKQALDGDSLKLDFVYGTIEDNELHPLDGQQRLTTLWLMHWYIALFTGDFDDAFRVLSKFSYETRISSRDFIQNLCNPEHFEHFDCHADRDVVSYIKNSTWYYSAWDQDPTIASMLRMINGTGVGSSDGADDFDGLRMMFAKASPEDFKRYWVRLTTTNAIAFYLQPLKDFGLSDDLYVKMNARGKQLTPFENFKAELIGFLRDQERDNKNSVEVRQQWRDLLDHQHGIPIKLDTDWSDLFWKNRSQDFRIDEIYFAFINRFFWNELFTAKDGDGKYILEIPSDTKNASFEYFNADAFHEYTGLKPYLFYHGSIPPSFFERLKVVLDRYASFRGTLPVAEWWGVGFAFIPRYTTGQKAEISGINQRERIIFFALCKYFVDGLGEQESLASWMRVVYNLISGTDRENAPEIRDVENVRRAIAYLDSLDSHNAIASLASKEKEEDDSSVLARRWNEEIDKAVKMNAAPEWRNRIIQAENYAFFHGAIRFLFHNENGEVNWSDFDAKWASVQKFFEKDGDSDNVMREGYANAQLLKILFSRFTTKNFWDNLFWNYRTFNNKPSTWMYYLLSADLCMPVHHMLLGQPLDAQWANRSSSSDFTAEDALHLLTHTGLLDYTMKYLDKSWIRSIHNHYAIYPSSEGVFLDATERDRFLLNASQISVEEYYIIPNTPLLFGWDVNFTYKDHDFQWYRDDCIYLLSKSSNGSYDYPTRESDATGETPSYYCFDTAELTDSDIFSKLDELIEEYTKR